MRQRQVGTVGLLAAVALLGVMAAPAAALTRGPLPQTKALEVPDPTDPPRDVVLRRLGVGLAKAQASAQRYPVHDRKGRTVEIAVSPGCNLLTCNAANPQQIADFLGTVAHGNEMESLTVQLLPATEITLACGALAGACYFVGADTMLINGSDNPQPDGADREFVIAHEYGHHVAQHRRNPPFDPAIAWGTKRWGTYERICQGTRAGIYFPGDQGTHYFQNPGEAFAEAFAFNRFRDTPVAWAWSQSLKPDREAFQALRQDTLRPWKHRTRFVLIGRLPRGGPEAVTKRFRTPLDGTLSLRLQGPPGADFDLLLRDKRGRLLASSRGLGARESLNFMVCGQARLRAVVKRAGAGAGSFRLVVRRP